MKRFLYVWLGPAKRMDDSFVDWLFETETWAILLHDWAPWLAGSG